MRKSKRFIIVNLPVLLFVFLSLFIFFLVFFLTKLEIQYYQYAASFILFLLVIYLVTKYMTFQDLDIEKELTDVNNELKELRERFIEEREDIQEYFLIWNHQMKTPITAAKMILESEKSFDYEKIKKLRMELLQIEDYSNSSLNYLKLVNPSTDMDFVHTNLDNIIRQILRRYRIYFIYNALSIEFIPSNVIVLSDPRWLQILLEQIINNAIKYTTKGRIKIYFKDQSLYIEDEGIGIRKEDLYKIFDKGYSGFNGRYNQKSTGLGLFIVNKISKRLNLKVDVDSRIGKGSIFRITFLTVL